MEVNVKKLINTEEKNSNIKEIFLDSHRPEKSILKNLFNFNLHFLNLFDHGIFYP